MLSFVAHSLGGVIVRAAVCRDEAAWLRPRLHCLLTINSPHLGLAYVGKGINLGIQFMQWYVVDPRLKRSISEAFGLNFTKRTWLSFQCSRFTSIFGAYLGGNSLVQWNNSR